MQYSTLHIVLAVSTVVFVLMAFLIMRFEKILFYTDRKDDTIQNSDHVFTDFGTKSER